MREIDQPIDEPGRTSNAAEESVQKTLIPHLSLRQPEKLLNIERI